MLDCQTFSANIKADELILPKHLARLEKEITSGWNPKPPGSRVPRILVVGTSGYIKRDLPIYEMALSKSTQFQLLRQPAVQPNVGKKKAQQQQAALTSEDFDVLLCLSFNTDSCLLPEDFPALVPRNKKVNRINHLRTILWSKHSFCNTLSRAALGYSGDKDFFFPCWVLPDQYDELMQNRLGIKRWISKPRSLGAGMGISIVDDLRDISPRSTHVIQEYMMNPYLIRMSSSVDTLHKWDMRTYVLVTSVVPLRAYVFQRGLVRFAMTAYSSDCKSNNQTACLTNTSINKKIGAGAAKDITWPFSKLGQNLGKERYSGMMEKMKRAIGMMLLAAMPEFIAMQRDYSSQCESCYQLLGVDVIFDAELNPKVIECNGEPSMLLNGGKTSHYDTTKRLMIENLVSLVFQPKPAAARLANALQARCGGGGDANNVKLKRTDAAYLLDLYREHEAVGEFARIYPATNADHATAFRSFLLHMSTSNEYTKRTQTKLKELVRSHDVFAKLLPENGHGEEEEDVTAAKHQQQDDDRDNDDV